MNNSMLNYLINKRLNKKIINWGEITNNNRNKKIIMTEKLKPWYVIV